MILQWCIFHYCIPWIINAVKCSKDTFCCTYTMHFTKGLSCKKLMVSISNPKVSPWKYDMEVASACLVCAMCVVVRSDDTDKVGKLSEPVGEMYMGVNWITWGIFSQVFRVPGMISSLMPMYWLTMVMAWGERTPSIRHRPMGLFIPPEPKQVEKTRAELAG